MQADEAKPDGAVPAGLPAELGARFERLRALRSAWGVLAVSAISPGGHPVAGIGRALGDHLNEIAAQGASGCDPKALPAADAGLDEFARMLRTIAFQVPIDELRAQLPARLRSDRRGVLDLLDLLIDFDVAVDERPQNVGAIDYVITLLCTATGPDGRGAIREDPATLTPRMHALCQRAQAGHPAEELAAIEAEFFAASNMDAADVHVEMAQRKLRRRKAELGPAFFAPGVLRAIVSYNAGLLERVRDEISDSQDWGALPHAGAPVPVEAGGSVLDSEALRRLGEALRRRASGAAPESAPRDRVAWCLDLDSLDARESAALLGAGVGTAENLPGTAILVGLLRRSLVVLADELPGVGIAPDALDGAWPRELEKALKAATNRLIAGDAYDEACALAALKTKFLSDRNAAAPRAAASPRPAPAAREASVRPATGARPPADARQRTPAPEAPAKPERPATTLETARQLASDALEGEQRAAAPDGFRLPQWARSAALVAATLVFVVLGTNFVQSEAESDLARFGSHQLEAVSPHLRTGERSGHGEGSAFVGTLERSWDELDEHARAEAALDLVASLHAQGVREIMVYDRDGRLRLQVLGEQPMRLVP